MGLSIWFAIKPMMLKIANPAYTEVSELQMTIIMVSLGGEKEYRKMMIKISK